MMAEASIPVDLRNPGQVFACLGFMEAAAVLCGPGVEGRHQVAPGTTRGRFHLRVPDLRTPDGMEVAACDPVATVLAFLLRAEVRALAPAGSALAVKEPGVATVAVPPGTFPCPEPDAPAALPAELVDPAWPAGPDDGPRLPLGHWADGPSGRDNVKFWAGAGGYSGAALARDALDLARAACAGEALAAAVADPFAVQAAQSSSFRFDWRRDYIPLDAGFSPNRHTTMVMVGHPLVELLAAIGLQHARPQRPERRDKLQYRYGVSAAWLPLPLARAVLGGQGMGFPLRCFRMVLGWPGQEDQARCIIDAWEEPPDDR